MKTALLFALPLLASCKQGGAPTVESSTSQVAVVAPSGAALSTASTANALPGTGAPVATISEPPGQSANSQGPWNFNTETARAPPSGFKFGRTGHGREGRWSVIAAPSAPRKPDLLPQVDGRSTDHRFPVALLRES